MIKKNHREEILKEFAIWAAISALKSGRHIKDRETLRNALISKVNIADIPANEEKFDEWHRNTTEKIHAAITTKKNNKSELPFSIGWAAKLLNVYLKSLFYIGDFSPKEIRRFLHPPIDNILVAKIKVHYKLSVNDAKTKFTISGIESYASYRNIIDNIKGLTKSNQMENLLDIEHVWLIS